MESSRAHTLAVRPTAATWCWSPVVDDVDHRRGHVAHGGGALDQPLQLRLGSRQHLVLVDRLAAREVLH